jgi:hypothetical protein
MTHTIYLICMCHLVYFNLHGQDTVKCDNKYFKDELLDKITGQWNLSGEIRNEKVENNFTAGWILNHQFLELNFTDVVTPPGYMARVTIGYDCISERYVVHWLDNYGGRYSETLGNGTIADQSIVFRFEYPDGPFLNSFIYHKNNDSWQFHMTTKNDKGEWVVFGDEYLKRKK